MTTPNPSTTGTVLGEADPLSVPCFHLRCGSSPGIPCVTGDDVPCAPHRQRIAIASLVAAARGEGAAAERERWATTEERYEGLLDLYDTAMHAALREPGNAGDHLRAAFAELDRRARSTS